MVEFASAVMPIDDDPRANTIHFDFPQSEPSGPMRRAIRHLQDDAGNTDGGRPVWQDPRFVGKSTMKHGFSSAPVCGSGDGCALRKLFVVLKVDVLCFMCYPTGRKK